MLNIGNKVYRNLPEQVAENIKQIDKIWERLDGLDVYDNVLVLTTLDPLTEDQLEIIARPVSFIVYNNNVYMKRGASASDLYFDKVYNVSESSGTITFASGEIVVTYPLGTIALNSSSVDTYSTSKIDTLLSAKLNVSDVLNSVYPVGAIYMSVVSTSPASLFGGTWEKLKDRFLLGDGDNYSAGATGGEATHTLTISEIPEHHHTVETYAGGVGDAGSAVQRGWSGATTQVFPATTNEGGSQAHNNMPPYLVVYMWKRTA